MEEFVPSQGQYNITSNQKGALEEKLRQQLVINKNSKKGIVHKTIIDGEEYYMKNGGNKTKPVWYLKPKGLRDEQHAKREAAMNYADPTTEAKRKSRKFQYKKNVDPKFADEAYMINVKTYEEHSVAAQSGVKLPEGIGTDDVENVSLRVDGEFDVDNVKAAKDDFEDFAKRNGNPWHAFHNNKTDELQIINQQEWHQKGNGEFVDIFEDGVTLNKYEVTQWKKAVKTGKLGKFPLKKAAYLLKELNNIPGLKPTLTAAGLTGISALLDTVEAKEGFQQLFAEENSKQERDLAILKTAAGVTGISTLFTPVTAPYAMALGGMHAIKSTVDAQKIKKRNELMMSLGLEMLPNGEIRDRQYNPVNVDLETGEVIPHQLGQGPVKKLTSRGSR